MSQEIWLDFPYKTQVLLRRCFKSAVRVRVVAQKSAVRVRLVAQGSELSSGFVFLRENRKGFPYCNLLTFSAINFTPKFKTTL